MTKIESNSFQHLNKLKKLNFYENKIEQIETNGFQGLDNLEELNFYNGNSIEIIDSNLIQNMKKLKYIH